MKIFAAIFFLFSIFNTHAEEGMLKLDVSRNGAHLPLYVMSNPNALATLILLPGGDAGTGNIVEGNLHTLRHINFKSLIFILKES